MKKRQYPKESIEKAVQFVQNKQGSISLAAKTFGVPRTSITYKIKHPDTKFKSGPDTFLTSAEEQDLVNYIISLSKRGFPRKKDDILDSVQSFLKENPRSNPFTNGRPGIKWFASFLKRHPLLTQRTAEGVTNASACISEYDIRKWFTELEIYFKDANLMSVLEDPTRIYNADETCFHICPSTGKVISEKGSKNVYVIEKGSPKENITVMFAFSASGRTCAPMIIYPYQRIPERIAESVPTGWGIGRSENGWMTAPVFYEYIANVFHPDLIAAKVQFPVILYVDGHKTHLTKEVSELCKSLEIHLIALYPNATRILQPADVASFKPIKAGWRKYLRLWYAENESGEVLNKQSFAPLLKKVVDSTTNPAIAVNGFRTTGLFPFNPDAINYEKCLGKKLNEPFPSGTQDSISSESSMTFAEFKTIVGCDRIALFENALKNMTHFENEETEVIYNLWIKFLGSKETHSIEKPECSDSAVEHRETAQSVILDHVTGELQPSTVTDAEPTIIDYDEPQPSTSRAEPPQKVTILSNESLSDYLKRKMWPSSPTRKGKRQTERVPYALTSDTYMQMIKEKELKKQQLNTEKENKKRLREEKKILAETKKNKGKGKKTRREEIAKDESEKDCDQSGSKGSTDLILSNVNSNYEKRCDRCFRRIFGVNDIECGMCQKKFHVNCVPADHQIHIPMDEEDDFVCHECYRLNTSGSSTDECFERFQEEARKNGFI